MRFGALSATTFAASAIVAPLIGASPAWAPIALNLHAEPAAILPATVSVAKPVTVVRTSLDRAGRPVITRHRATSTAGAAKLVRDAQAKERTVAVEVDAPVYALGAPTGADPSRANQWDLGKVRVPEAWNSSTGAGVIVAVLDTGVDAGHPDLAGQVLPGYNALTGQTGQTADVQGHGTHVSGTIAAATGNDVGISAIAPDTRILPVKVLGDNGSGTMSAVADGIVWAADHGAQVINMSLGASSQVGAVTNAIAYARSKNVVVVAAVGNDRAKGSPTSYPGADPGVIGVAATDSADRYGSFSNAGAYVDIAAPGVGILSTVPNSGYAYYNGTSMASPHVAALAALLRAKQPGLTPDQVQQAMESTAVDLGSSGRDNDYGYGRIDAAAALNAVGQAPSAPPAPTPAPTPTPEPAPAGVVITSDGASGEVLYNTTVKTTYTVTIDGAVAAKRAAKLCTADKGAAFKCKSATTTKDGTYVFSRKVTFPYAVMLKIEPVKKSPVAGESAAAEYTVRSAVTLAAGKKNSLVVTMVGTAKQVNVLQRSADGVSWETDRTFKASARTTLSKVLPGFQYQVVVPDVALVGGSTSNAVAM